MDQKKLNIQFDENIPSDNFDNLSHHESGLCLCTSAVQQVLENSVVTRGEVEEFSQLIIVKDNQIKNVEDKLSELEIKMAVYKEKLNIDEKKIQDKEDLVKSLTLSVDLLKTINEQNNNKISSLKTQIDQLMSQENTSDELKKVSNELRLANDRTRDKNDVIQKLKNLKAQTTVLDNKENWRLETCISQIKNLEVNNEEMTEKMAQLTTKSEEKDIELSKKMEHIERLEAKVECLEKEIFKKDSELEKNEKQIKNNSELVSEVKEKNIELEECRKNISDLKSKVKSLEQELNLVSKFRNDALMLNRQNIMLNSESKKKDINLAQCSEGLKEMETKVEGLEQEIKQKNLLLKNNDRQMTAFETEISNVKDHNTKLDAEIKKKNIEIKKYNENLKSMENKVKCTEQELKQKNLLLKNKESQMIASETTINNLKDNNSNLNSEIKKKDIELKKCNEDLKKMKAKVECTEQELIQKNVLLKNNEIKMRASEAAMKALVDGTSFLDSEIKKKDIELKKCNEDLKKMKTKVECTEQELIQKNVLLQNNESNITASETAMKNLRDCNSNLDSEIKKKDIELKKCNEVLKKMKTKVECIEQELIQNIFLNKKKESAIAYSETKKNQIEVQRNIFHSINWIVIGIQKKTFDVKTMTDYRNGFSSPNGNYWIGLEELHRLTEHYGCELYLQLDDDKVVICKNFRVGCKEDEYRLKNIGSWTGDKSIYMRKYEGGIFRIYNSSKLGWWLPEAFAYSDKWLLIERTMIIKMNSSRDS